MNDSLGITVASIAITFSSAMLLTSCFDDVEFIRGDSAMDDVCTENCDSPADGSTAGDGSTTEPDTAMSVCDDGTCSPDEDARTCPADCAPDETECADTEDNDGDLLADCADPDCASYFLCTPGMGQELTCLDGVDNDGDGAIDCADQDCIEVFCD